MCSTRSKCWGGQTHASSMPMPEGGLPASQGIFPTLEVLMFKPPSYSLLGVCNRQLLCFMTASHKRQQHETKSGVGLPEVNVGPIATSRAKGEVTPRVFAPSRSVLNFRLVMESGLWYRTCIELLWTLHELSTQKSKAQSKSQLDLSLHLGDSRRYNMCLSFPGCCIHLTFLFLNSCF